MDFLFPRDDAADDVDSPYNYVPSKVAGSAFVILFGLAALIHAVQAIKYRMWLLIPTLVLGSLLEIVGWGARLMSAYKPAELTPFMIQTAALIIAPTFVLAANFCIYKGVSTVLGPKYSRFRPKLYAIFFLLCDVAALGIQGYGGALAAIAARNDDLDAANHGSRIMLGGIGFQLVIIVLYMALSTEFFIRYIYDRPFKGSEMDARGEFTTHTKFLVLSLILTALFIFIRAIYRTIELADGWTGEIIATEWYFNVFDGTMIVLAIWTFNILNPGYLMKRIEKRAYRYNMVQHNATGYRGVPVADKEGEPLTKNFSGVARC